MVNRNLRTFGESLLAAPPSVTGSEEETARVLKRQAKATAEAARLKSHKSKKNPTPEELLADIIRVAEDKDTNPIGYKFQSITAKRYELYGHFPIEYVHTLWGQFNLAKEIAGLSEKQGTKTKNRAVAANSRREHADRYLATCVKPYAISDPVFARDLKNDKLMLVISDTHATYLDPFTWFSFLSACRALKPDIVLFNGDILEGSAISTHPKIIGATIDLQLEFDFARTMFEQTREICGPDTDIFWNSGNHGMPRMARYMSQQMSAFAGLRCMRFDELAGLKDLNIQLMQGGGICSPVGTERDKDGFLLYGFYYPRHGVKLGENPALAELKASGLSGTTGHVHRAGIAFGTTMANQALSHLTTPMGCDEEAGRAYMPGPTTGWQRGFGLVHLMPGRNVRQYPVITDNGVCVVEGHIVTQTKEFKDRDVHSNWLKDLRMP